MSVLEAPASMPVQVVESMTLQLVASSDLPTGAVVDAADRPGLLFGVVAGESLVVEPAALAVALGEALDRAHRAGLHKVLLDVDVMVDAGLLGRAVASVERNRAVFFEPAA